MVNSQNKQGFTLVELMIVVAIIGILAAIAYSSYTRYKIRTNRADVQAEMMQQAQHLQSYYVINHNYDSATLNNGSLTKDFPASGSVYTMTLVPNGQIYNLTAEPKFSTIQVNDGAVGLNSQGQKCWTKGSTCTPSATSNWDGR